MRKYKSQKGVALIFAIMIIAIMSIVGALALYIANRESKSVIAEQQKTRAYYAARTGADIADKFISSTPKKDVIDLFTRYEGAKMTKTKETIISGILYIMKKNPQSPE